MIFFAKCPSPVASRKRRGKTRFLAALLLFAAPPAHAAPAPSQQQLQEAERTRAALLQAQQSAAIRAAAAQTEERRLADERVAAATRLRGLETATADAANRIADLAARRGEAEARIAIRAAELAPLLPLAERLSLYPAETLLAVPLPMDDAVRGVLVLRGMTRAIEADAADLRAQQAAIDAIRRQIDAGLPRLAASQAAQAREATALDARLAATRDSRRAAEDAGAEAARRAAAEAGRADTIRAAIARIEADSRATEARLRAEALAQSRQRRESADATRQRQEAAARPAGPGIPAPASGEGQGGMTAPVAGAVIHSFGEAGDAGPATFIAYQSPPAARVVAPCAGRVVFAAPFRSFGQLMILDCGGGAHIVLSGLERLDAPVGQRVLAGEPVGVMPAWDPRAGLPRPVLKLELRRDGAPVNPAPFLRARG